MREVATLEDLKTLPDQSVILDVDGDALQKEGGRWYRTGDNEEWAPEHISDWFPAHLIHRGPSD